MGLGDDLRAYRLKRGLTQDSLANLLEVDERVVRRWENDESTPNPKHLDRIRRLVQLDGDVRYDNFIGFSSAPWLFSFGFLLKDLTEPDNLFASIEEDLFADIAMKIRSELAQNYVEDIRDSLVDILQFKLEWDSAGKKYAADIDCRVLRDMPQPLVVVGCRYETVVPT